MLAALLLLPLCSAALSWVLPGDRGRRALLVGTAAAHFGLTVAVWIRRPGPLLSGWLAADALGLLFLGITSLLFLAVAAYSVGYLRRASMHRAQGETAGGSEAGFTACLLLFLAFLTLVTLCQHFGLLWVAVEATTLATAPLIYFQRSARSLEATWKYLLLCSVGIALALLGTFFLAASAPGGGLSLSALLGRAAGLHPVWFKAAFLFLLVGYGTKMGLAPMHTWLPDAHSEAPSPVSALLSGALLNGAFLAVLRVQQVAVAARLGGFGRDDLLALGLVSLAVAAVFILHQDDFKRLLAYSSVEHMGILAVGIGLGGEGTFGALFQAVNHSLAKGLLFMTAGNLLAAYGTKLAAEVRGAPRILPVSGVLWVAGFLAVTGTPPFGTFLSELVILKAALATGRYAVAAVYLFLLAVIFVGLLGVMLRMVQGEAPKAVRPMRESVWTTVPAAALGLMALMLGLVLPPWLDEVLRAAAALLGGS